MTEISSPVLHAAAHDLTELDAVSAAEQLADRSAGEAAAILRSLSPDKAEQIFERLAPAQQAAIENNLPEEILAQWKVNRSFAEGSIGRLMEAVSATFLPDMTVGETVEVLRELVKKEFVTYGYIVDPAQKLLGVLVMRELLFADHQSKLRDVMLPNPFSLNADMPVMDAVKSVLSKHFPVYPITDTHGTLIGQIRGSRLFEAQAFEISAQAGSMVGVEKEEKLTTPWIRSFTYRHPWLQLNLLTAFVAGAVVSVFQDTIDQIVILAAFLPVLAGQSGNTGCQALAVTLRGMALGELKEQGVKKLLFKEGLLGFLNGALVGITAALGMYLLATHQGSENALELSIVVFLSMIGSCLISGLSGALVPLGLKRVGADPATASSIFLTTATDVVSMGMLLFLASRVLL